jgi:hypothetical protein
MACAIRDVDFESVLSSSTLERFRPFDQYYLMAEIDCIKTSLCLYK